MESLTKYLSEQQSLKLNDDLHPSEIALFENRNGVLIPPDFARCLKVANGFKVLEDDREWNLDDEGFEFYPLLDEHLVSANYLCFCG